MRGCLRGQKNAIKSKLSPMPEEKPSLNVLQNIIKNTET